MKSYPAILLVMTVLLPIFMGCNRQPQYDRRLVQADSVMQSSPIRALATLENVRLDARASDWDHAYHALLLTQAQYRCHEPLVSDSVINNAVNYYRSHSHEREKLTRAYIYKGAVMEELGRLDSAILYYKQGELTAAPDDYFNLAYVKMRMGALYRDNYSMDGRHIRKYEEALNCLNHIDNPHYQLVCMINLGSLYCLKAPERADSILRRALTLAEAQCDTINIVTSTQNLIKSCIGRHDYDEAYRLVRQVLDMNPKNIGNPLYIYAAHVYARLQKPDSAQILLSKVNSLSTSNAVENISYLESQREIALSRGDQLRNRRLQAMLDHKQDTLLALPTALAIMQVEDNFDQTTSLQAQASHNSTIRKLWLLIALVTLAALTIIAAMLAYRRRSAKKLLLQLHESNETQLNELNTQQNNLKQLNINDEQLTTFITAHMSLMRNMIEGLYQKSNREQQHQIKEIIKFQKDNKDKWVKLYGYIDMEYNNIISKTQAEYPQLNDRDILLLALSTLDFSCIQIAMILGYSNPSSVGPVKQRMASKMGLDGTLDSYIDRFKKRRVHRH